jgi:hypothetical protein
MPEWDVRSMLVEQGKKLDRIEAVLNQLYAVITGMKLQLVFSQGETAMSKVKFKMAPKGKGMQAVMPSVKWSTLAAGAQFQVVDANGTPVGAAVKAADVDTTLVANDTNTPPGVSTLATTTAGADSLSYKISRTQATGNIVLNATLTFHAGSPGPFTASQPIELDALTPGAPTDLQLVISGN